MKRATAFDILVCIALSAVWMVNLALFLPLLAEQIRTGWGYGTNAEMGMLLVWLIELCSLPFLLLGTTHFCISAATHADRRFRVVNAALTISCAAFIALSAVFAFH